MTTVFENEFFQGAPKQDGIDNHAHVVPADDVVYRNCTFNPNGASEGWKSSGHWNIRIEGGATVGHAGEDKMDGVKGGGLVIDGHDFREATAPRDLTVKASYRDIRCESCPGLRVIEAGNYSKYDKQAIYPGGRVVKALPWRLARPPVRNGHVTAAPGEPKVIVRLYHSEPWTGDVINKPIVPWMPLHRLLIAFGFWARATFWKEKHPPLEEDFVLSPREL